MEIDLCEHAHTRRVYGAKTHGVLEVNKIMCFCVLYGTPMSH